MNVMSIRHVKDDAFNVEGRMIYADNVDVFSIQNEYMALVTLEVMRRYYKIAEDQPTRDVIGAKIGRLKRLIDSRWPDETRVDIRRYERVRAREEQWVKMIKHMCNLIIDGRTPTEKLQSLARRHLAKTEEGRT